ncbi:hypothetical protein E1171_01325 [Cytophagales bacterium RKSG123]|nr:hypothetical protein [Xanthovirga aplysinae]
MTKRKTAQKLKMHLPHGAIKKVAEKVGKSNGYVSMVVSGTSDNLKIMQMIAEEAKKEKQRKQDVEKKVNAL